MKVKLALLLLVCLVGVIGCTESGGGTPPSTSPTTEKDLGGKAPPPPTVPSKP